MSNSFIPAIKSFIQSDLDYCNARIAEVRLDMEKLETYDEDFIILLGVSGELHSQQRSLESYIRLCDSFINIITKE